MERFTLGNGAIVIRQHLPPMAASHPNEPGPLNGSVGLDKCVLVIVRGPLRLPLDSALIQVIAHERTARRVKRAHRSHLAHRSPR
jgi:hypothetical protein